MAGLQAFIDQHDIVSCIDTHKRKKGDIFFQIQGFDLSQVPISLCTVERTWRIYELFVGTGTRNQHGFSFLLVVNYDLFQSKQKYSKDDIKSSHQ